MKTTVLCNVQLILYILFERPGFCDWGDYRGSRFGILEAAGYELYEPYLRMRPKALAMLARPIIIW
jgi:hypothetical protein